MVKPLFSSKKDPHEDIICSIENTIKALPNNIVEDIRQEYAIVLKNARPHKRNITMDEYSALKRIKNKKYIIILY